LEGTEGWMKLHNEELIWKEQKVGENYINRRFVRCIFRQILLESGARGGVVVKALRNNPEDRGFDSRWCHWNFS
jgi:hypothetical protein